MIDDYAFGFHYVTLLSVIFDTSMYIIYLHITNWAFFKIGEYIIGLVYYSYFGAKIFSGFGLEKDRFLFFF